jgi:hypothetical protein
LVGWLGGERIDASMVMVIMSAPGTARPPSIFWGNKENMMMISAARSPLSLSLHLYAKVCTHFWRKGITKISGKCHRINNHPLSFCFLPSNKTLFFSFLFFSFFHVPTS